MSKLSDCEKGYRRWISPDNNPKPNQTRAYGCVKCQKVHREDLEPVIFQDHIVSQSKHGWYWMDVEVTPSLEDTIRAILREKGEPMPFSILALDVMAKLPNETNFYIIHDCLNQLLSEQRVKLTTEGKYTI